MKNRGEVICPKLVEKNARANERMKKIEREWRSDYSMKVEKETGVGGWEAVGPISSTSLWPRTNVTANWSRVVMKEVVKTSKNPFYMGDDDDVSEEEVVEEVPAVVAEEMSLSGAWAKPLKVGEVAEEKGGVDTVNSVGLTDYDPNLCWGDQW